MFFYVVNYVNKYLNVNYKPSNLNSGKDTYKMQQYPPVFGDFKVAL